MKKVILGVIVAALVIAATIIVRNAKRGTDTGSNPDNKPVVKIGAQFPLTGDMSDLGVVAQKALTKSIEDANNNPENKLHYELLVEDNQFKPLVANSIANKLISVNKVNVLVDEYASIARVTAPLAEKNKIPSFHHAISSDFINSKYNFINYPTNEEIAERAVRLLNGKNIKNVTIAFANYGPAEEMLKGLLPKLEYNNITFTIERFNYTEKDFNILVGKIKHRNTDAVIVFSPLPALDILAREFNRQNIGKTIIFLVSADLSNRLDIFEGMYAVSIVHTPVSLREHIGFGDDEHARKVTPIYDTGTFITQAFEKAYDGTHIPTGDEVADQLLSQREYQGYQNICTLDERGQFHSRTETYIVKNGKFVLVTED